MKNYCLYDQAVLKMVDGEYFILAQDGETIFSINGLGGEILELLKVERSFDHLLEQIVDKFEVLKSEAAKDLQAFIDDLLQEGIIKIV